MERKIGNAEVEKTYQDWDEQLSVWITFTK